MPLVLLGLTLVCLGPLSLNPGLVPFPPRSQFTDLLVSHLPNAAYIAGALRQGAGLPLWNTQQFGGQPFAADPLAGLWYPPNWLTWAAPAPLVFNLLLALHLTWGGWGLYRFLRAQGLRAGPALLGGLTFAGTPKLVAHLGAGHVSLVCAVAWLPWLLHAVSDAAERGGVRRGALAGVLLAVTFLADVRWALYAGLLGAAWWAWCAGSHPKGSPGPLGAIRALLAVALAGLGLSAPLALPLLEFVRLSGRETLTYQEAAAFSLPRLYLLGLLIPDLRGFHEYMTYVGVIPLLLSLAGLRRRTLFWGLAALAAALFALGENFVLFPAFFNILPGLSLLRVPARAWFIVALGVAVLAAHGAQAVASWLAAARAPAGARLLTPGSLRRAARWLLPGALLLTTADLVRVDSTLVDPRPLPGISPAAAWLREQPGTFRVYSPSYSLPPGDGQEHVDGVNPLHLRAARDFIEAASGVRASGYSVTLPAFESPAGQPLDLAGANARAVPDARLLGLLNVKYIAAEFDLAAEGLVRRQTFEQTRVYENLLVQPRAWTPAGPAEIVERSSDRIRLRARGPGPLVLSEAAYPGWQASVDGQPAPIAVHAGLLRQIELGPGAHDVLLEFRPLSVYLGLGVALLAGGLLAGAWRWAG